MTELFITLTKTCEDHNKTVWIYIYRHTITGLAPNTQYRVTVRAKHHRAASNVANLAEDLPMPAAAHTDFRTLPKGLPDPPSEIQVEPGDAIDINLKKH